MPLARRNRLGLPEVAIRREVQLAFDPLQTRVSEKGSRPHARMKRDSQRRRHELIPERCVVQGSGEGLRQKASRVFSTSYGSWDVMSALQHRFRSSEELACARQSDSGALGAAAMMG